MSHKVPGELCAKKALTTARRSWRRPVGVRGRGPQETAAACVARAKVTQAGTGSGRAGPWGHVSWDKAGRGVNELAAAGLRMEGQEEVAGQDMT